MKKHKEALSLESLALYYQLLVLPVGLGNIWRFPYLAAKYGGGIFLLVYIILALTFGYTLIMAETSGRMTRKALLEHLKAGKLTFYIYWWLDQCNHSGFDRAILFGDRWMGFKISG